MGCKEFYENSCFCDDGVATWTKNTFTKYKAEWGLNKEKQIGFYSSNKKFALGRGYSIVKLTSDELVLAVLRFGVKVEEVHFKAK